MGSGAADLKFQNQFVKGVNLWHSFKMELGVDLGTQYFNSQLGAGHPQFTIQNPKDAAKVFFLYLNQKLKSFIQEQGLPAQLSFAVSIPASFEANQRRDLIEALEYADIKLGRQNLIDEPNAAFLSYLLSTERGESAHLKIAPDYPMDILVFDFGAGTCDISVLQVGLGPNGVYSKNLSISRFERLGGDDIDRLIAMEFLFPQLLEAGGYSRNDFRTPQINKGILPRLLKAAEELKIQICKEVAKRMHCKELPALANSEERIQLATPIEVVLPGKKMRLEAPSLSFKDFGRLMNQFTQNQECAPRFEDQDAFISFFNPIQSALEKAELKAHDVDYVLLIGGSSYNPWVQHALSMYFDQSEMIIPQDLQAHVSEGAAIHSFLYNGFGVNVIKPITSEPLLAVTKGGEMRTVLPAGTEIPCEAFVIDNLETQRQRQTTIELPICVSDGSKILHNIKITDPSGRGFPEGTPVKLECSVTADKLVHLRAFVGDIEAVAEPVNPFANRSLTTDERTVLRAEKAANEDAARNSGKPSQKALEDLYRAYANSKRHLRAAETLEAIIQTYGDKDWLNSTGYHYGRAGRREKAQECYDQAYEHSPTPTTAFNSALTYKYADRDKYRDRMEAALRMDPSYPYALHYYGEFLLDEGDQRGREMVQKAYDRFKSRFDAGRLDVEDYSRLEECARILGKNDVAENVAQSPTRATKSSAYDEDNLVRQTFSQAIAKQ